MKLPASANELGTVVENALKDIEEGLKKVERNYGRYKITVYTMNENQIRIDIVLHQ